MSVQTGKEHNKPHSWIHILTNGFCFQAQHYAKMSPKPGNVGQCLSKLVPCDMTDVTQLSSESQRWLDSFNQSSEINWGS